MSAVAFFRLRCDGGCGRWLSDITGNDVARLTSSQGRALTFVTHEEAEQAAVTVGWTKCRCPRDIVKSHLNECEKANHRALCGNCRARLREP